MPTVIDPRLPNLPATGVSYDDSQITSEGIPELLEVLDTDAALTDFVFEDSVTTGGYQLDPPSSITVVSQTVKVGAAGTQTVDIVIDILDVVGASEYERRDGV